MTRPSPKNRHSANKSNRKRATARRAPVWWMQAKPVTSSVRYPRLAAVGFLLAVTLVTLAATLGVLWLFVPEVAARIVEQAVLVAQRVADFAQDLTSRITVGR